MALAAACEERLERRYLLLEREHAHHGVAGDLVVLDQRLDRTRDVPRLGCIAAKGDLLAHVLVRGGRQLLLAPVVVDQRLAGDAGTLRELRERHVVVPAREKDVCGGHQDALARGVDSGRAELHVVVLRRFHLVRTQIIWATVKRSWRIVKSPLWPGRR